MLNPHLASCLCDHFASATAASLSMVDLACRLADDPVADVLEDLHTECEADLELLEDLAWRLDIPLRAVAVSTRSKSLEEGLESIATVVAGKRLLWHLLAMHAEHDDALDDIDFERLIEAAVRQRQSLDEVRLATARLQGGSRSLTHSGASRSPSFAGSQSSGASL